MGQTKRDIDLGRFLSLVLRHKPEAAGVHLDENGWADVPALLSGCARAGKNLDLETLERIVRENDKRRYSFNDDHSKIRANQGHSIAVDVELKKAPPPQRLYHGTAQRFIDSIRKQGITAQSRQYVHLSADADTAVRVGKRHGVPVVLTIDAKAMAQDGYSFFLSENGVWLCERVPCAYLQFDCSGTDCL